jgi:hypothetical protein
MQRRTFIAALGSASAWPMVARAQRASTPPLLRLSVVQYSTDFANPPNPENPILEGGVWHHVGTQWTKIRTITGPNRAIGTQTGSGGFDDSYAYLTGFPADVGASATIYRDPTIVTDPDGSHEVEILLRWADTASTARGYECNLGFDGGYQEIVRWNGGFGNFTILSHRTSFPIGTMPPTTGDIFKATVSGSVISVYINKNDGKGDQVINTANDSTFTDGNPGMGMWLKGSFDPTKFGFTSYSATGL